MCVYLESLPLANFLSFETNTAQPNRFGWGQPCPGGVRQSIPPSLDGIVHVVQRNKERLIPGSAAVKRNRKERKKKLRRFLICLKIASCENNADTSFSVTNMNTSSLPMGSLS